MAAPFLAISAPVKSPVPATNKTFGKAYRIFFGASMSVPDCVVIVFRAKKGKIAVPLFDVKFRCLAPVRAPFKILEEAILMTI